jgi:GT2 family glycosyltransferase
MAAPGCSVVIVTWNTGDAIRPCLAALEAQGVPGLEVVVVDNASTDATLEHVAAELPGVLAIRLERNQGFAGAASRGVAATTADAVCLLNPDVVLGPGYLARCLQELAADPALGSVQGLLLRPGGTMVDSAGHLATRGRWVRNRGENQARDATSWVPADTFGVTAAAAVYRRAMLDDVSAVTGHVFDGAFFAYLEDVDLDWRARWRGWRSAVVDGAEAEHAHSGSGARALPWVQRHIIKNRILTLYRNEDAGNLLRYSPWILGQLAARLALAAVTAPSSLLGVVDALRLMPSQRGVRRAIRVARKVDAAAARAWFGPGGGLRGGLATRTPLPARPHPEKLG